MEHKPTVGCKFLVLATFRNPTEPLAFRHWLDGAIDPTEPHGAIPRTAHFACILGTTLALLRSHWHSQNHSFRVRFGGDLGTAPEPFPEGRAGTCSKNSRTSLTARKSAAPERFLIFKDKFKSAPVTRENLSIENTRDLL